ncbi:MAG TPA: hypothetical protein VFZ77_17220 [Acidimicrobiales bacterium]
MKRTITGRTGNGPMSLGDLRQFVSSLDALPDEAVVKARTRFASRTLRSITVEEDDAGFRDYIRAVGSDEGGKAAGRKSKETRPSQERAPV